MAPPPLNYTKKRGYMGLLVQPTLDQALGASKNPLRIPIPDRAAKWYALSPWREALMDTNRATNEYQAALLDYERLQMLYARDGPNDEALFSVAMARAGVRATARDPARILFAPLTFGSRLRIDVMAGRCELLNGDHDVPAVIVHFVFPWVLRYEYVREVMRLEAAFGKRAGLLRNDFLVRIAARATSFWLYRVPRIRRRIRRWKRRLSEMA